MAKHAPKEVGERSEGMVLAALLREKKVVLLPFGDSQRYDLVIDEGGEFLRVQVKTGRLKDGAIRFPCCSSYYQTYEKFNYRGQADLFGVYCPELDAVFLVPVDQVGVTEATLRTCPTKNGQRKGVRLAEDYVLGKWAVS